MPKVRTVPLLPGLLRRAARLLDRAARAAERPFWHPVLLAAGSPAVHRAETREYEHPYRVSRSAVIRLWPGPGGTRRGIVLGYWRDAELGETEAVLRAARFRAPGDGELACYDENTRDIAERSAEGNREVLRGRSRPGMAAAGSAGTGR